MIKVAVIGATGYVGQELVRLLLGHPQVKLCSLGSQTHSGREFSKVYPAYNQILDLICQEDDLNKLANEVDLVFLALPHGASAAKINAKLLQKTRFIDLGADFRLKNIETYESWYETKHACPDLLAQAVYGLCEWHRQEISTARLIANPGCYATCTELALMPLMIADILHKGSIVVDAKSGVSGAGRGLALSSHFNEVNESIKAYKVATHRHMPEIEQELSLRNKESVEITFAPHLIPMNRGILITAYGALKAKTTPADVYEIFHSAYGKEPFIRLFKPGVDQEYPLPETRFVKGSNYCDIGFTVDERNQRLIVVAAIDNLVKGAAGQAVQNMNILFSLDETTGLKQLPIFPG